MDRSYTPKSQLRMSVDRTVSSYDNKKQCVKFFSFLHNFHIFEEKEWKQYKQSTVMENHAES